MAAILIALSGLVIGSFLGALSWRLPRKVSITKGRSQCPECKKEIGWYDNIPLLSYLMLRGKCRHCGRAISIRYPLIEAATAMLFLLAYLRFPLVEATIPTPLPYILEFAFVLFLVSCSVLIFVVDLEHQIIPDTAVLLPLVLAFMLFVFSNEPDLYLRLLAGLLSALFFLALNILTKGKGMGLGDMKLALMAGVTLGFPGSAYWLFGSFIAGGFFSTILLIFYGANLKQKIAFGPFMVASYIFILLSGGFTMPQLQLI